MVHFSVEQPHQTLSASVTQHKYSKMQQKNNPLMQTYPSLYDYNQLFTRSAAKKLATSLSWSSSWKVQRRIFQSRCLGKCHLNYSFSDSKPSLKWLDVHFEERSQIRPRVNDPAGFHIHTEGHISRWSINRAVWSIRSLKDRLEENRERTRDPGEPAF